jgi:hypothetical protein
MNDYIPHNDDQFFDFSQNFIAQIDDSGARLNISTADKNALKAQNDGFLIIWDVFKNPNHGHADTVAKNTAKKAYQKYLRDFFNRHLRYNPAMTDADRVNFGVPIPSSSSVHIVVGDRRVNFELTPKGVFMVGIKCRDEDTGAKKILYGMSGIVVLYTISDKPVMNIAELSQSMLITRTTHTIRAADTQRGKWISVTVCWQSKTGERGQYAAIQSAIVP